MRRSTEKVFLDLKVKVWKSRHHDFRKKRGNGSLMDAPERNIVRASDPEFTHFYDKSGTRRKQSQIWQDDFLEAGGLKTKLFFRKSGIRKKSLSRKKMLLNLILSGRLVKNTSKK